MKVKKPILAKKPLIGAAVNFYGKRYFTKSVKLIHDDAFAQLKPPYIVVANHCGFTDVGGLIMCMYPVCANFVISVTQMAQWPSLIKHMGVLPKKQFTVDTSLVRDIKYVLDHKRPVVIYPEAKLSVVGKLNPVKPAIAKLIKMLKVPLVTVCFHGGYLHKPRWSNTKRFTPVYTDIRVAVTPEEVATVTVDEIYNRIIRNLTYDDYAYQLANGIQIDVPDLVEGLEHILYKCPSCGEEFAMTAHGNTLTCSKCGAAVTQNTLGQLVGGKFDKVTDWYEWQRSCVKDEISDPNYLFEGFFRAEKLVGKKYADMGDANLIHNAQGLTVTFGDQRLFYKAGALYTLSFNNDYVFLPSADAVYRFKRQDRAGCTTKLNLAVEEQAMLVSAEK